MTILRIEGVRNAEFRILVVPWMAGAMMSRPGLSVGRGNGEAMCSMQVTPLRELSNAPSTVKSGTITNSTALIKGMRSAFCLRVEIWLSLRTEMRTR